MSLARRRDLAAALPFLVVLLCACHPAGPQPAPSLLPPAPPSQTAEPRSYRPECFAEDAWVACQDPQLGLAFRYPAEWGFLVEARLSEGDCGGQTLVYRFEPFSSGPVNGGASPDYCQPGADPIQRFSGIPPDTGTELLDRCRQVLPQAAFCQPLGEQVWLAGLFSDAQTICQSAAGLVPEPKLAVAINLPDGRPVSGLVLAQVFLSPQEEAGLYAPLGGNPPNRGLCRQTEAQDAFQENVAALAQRVLDGKVDDVTRERVEAIQQLAESIQIDP